MAEENAEAATAEKTKARGSTAGIAAGAGVNMDDANEQALFFQGKAKYERLLAAKKAADKALQDHGKVIKSEFGDKGLGAIKLAIRLGTEDNAQKDIEAEIQLQLKVLRWMGTPIGSQAELFGQPDRRPAEEIAYDRGKLAGMEGKGMKDFGYDESSPQWQDAAKGWHDGQTAIFNIKGPEAPIVKQSKAKPGKKSETEGEPLAPAEGAGTKH